MVLAGSKLLDDSSEEKSVISQDAYVAYSYNSAAPSKLPGTLELLLL